VTDLDGRAAGSIGSFPRSLKDFSGSSLLLEFCSAGDRNQPYIAMEAVD
jgi:hypothetical protein